MVRCARDGTTQHRLIAPGHQPLVDGPVLALRGPSVQRRIGGGAPRQLGTAVRGLDDGAQDDALIGWKLLDAFHDQLGEATCRASLLTRGWPHEMAGAGGALYGAPATSELTAYVPSVRLHRYVGVVCGVRRDQVGGRACLQQRQEGVDRRVVAPPSRAINLPIARTGFERHEA